MKIHASILMVAIVLFFAGCVSKTRWEVASAQQNLMRLQVGMSMPQVIAIMGTPYSREVIPDRNGDPEFLQYQTKFAGDAVIFTPTDAHLTPFMFVDDRLVGWGRNFYDRTIRHEITVRQYREEQGVYEPKTSNDASWMEHLSKLEELRKAGVITQQEFDVEKQKILDARK